VSAFLRLPPRIKVLEALGAISDGRIEVLNDKEAIVRSSDGTRMYLGVRWIVPTMAQSIGGTLATQ